MIDLTERPGMGEMLTKVGPKGYIHGWIFVGAPGVGAEVYHPQHGRGKVTAHDGTHATVKFHSGGTHTFEAAHKPGAEHHFEPRGGPKQPERGSTPGVQGATRERMGREKEVSSEQRAKWNAHNTDRVMQDPKHIGALKDEDLRGVDQEFERRAALMGRAGDVGKTHQKVKDELKRRGAAKSSGSDHLKQSLDNKLDLSKLSDDELDALQTAHARAGGASDVRAERDAHHAAHTRVSAERTKRAERSQGANRAKYNKLSDAASAQGRKASAVGTPEAHDKAAQMHRVAAEAAMSPAARETHERRMAAHEKEAARLRSEVGDGKGPEKPAAKPRSKVPSLTAEGAKEPKMDLGPYGTMHPADAALQHSGWHLNTEQLRSAKTELERRGVTEGGRDKISQTHRRVSEQLARSEAHEKEFNKPGGYGDMMKAKSEADRLSEEADKKGTAAAHEAAAAANRQALTLSYRHEPGKSLTQQHLSTRARLHDMKAADQRTREPKFAEQKRKEYRTAASLAPDVRRAKSPLASAEQHEQGARQHRRAAELATTDAQRTKHEKAADAFDKAAADKRAATEQEKKDTEERLRQGAEENARFRAENEARRTANDAARRVLKNPKSAAKLPHDQVQAVLDRLNEAMARENPSGSLLEQAQMAIAALTARLKTAMKSAEADDVYWTEGEGAAKIAWTTAGSYDRALTYLGKYITDETALKTYCSKLYYQALGTEPTD